MELNSMDIPIENRIILEETFYVVSKKSTIYKVRLTTKGLHLMKNNEDDDKQQIILIKDIIGCQCLRSKKKIPNCTCQTLPRSDSLQVVEDNSTDLDDTDFSAYLYVYAYIFNGTKDLNKKRERTIITLRFKSFDKYEDNHREAQRWRCVIKKLIKGDSSLLNGGDSTISHFYNNNKENNKKLLILCNPKSGAGKGKQIFQQKVAPLLNEAEIPYDLYITKHSNFARDFVRTNNLYQWRGIIGVGGDGIIYEIINGIFERLDWNDVLKTVPLGVIPGGSGNGLARSIAHYCAEPYLASPTLPAVLAAVSGRSEAMDLVRVETVSQIIFSFLSVGWGFLSDVDIESEKLRVLGGTRFTVWSVARLIGLRSYKGKLWYLPSSTSDLETLSNSENSLEDFVNKSTTTNIDFPPEVLLETQEGEGDNLNSSPNRRIYGPASQLPSLTASVPANWKCMDGRFVMVHASYQSHLGEDCLFAPEARLNDGKIWLLIVRYGASRSQLLQFLLGLNKGAHAMSERKDSTGFIQLIAVNAFRIEPDMSQHGYMTVDGEHVEYGPIQAEVFPALANIMVP